MKRWIGFLAMPWMVSMSWALGPSTVAESSDFDSVVFFMAPMYDRDTKGEGVGLCNGQLLSSRVLVTAAHCVGEAYVMNRVELDMQLGQYVYKNHPDGKKTRIGYASKVREKAAGKAYFTAALKRKFDTQKLRTRIGPAEDLAVVIFDRDLSVRPEVVFPEIVAQKELAAIKPSIGRYNPRVVTINYIEEVASMDVRKMALLNSVKTNSSGYLESKSTARVAPGDSGGPVFVELSGQLKLAAVVKGRAETIFSNWDVYPILDQKICDIARQIPDSQVQAQLCH